MQRLMTIGLAAALSLSTTASFATTTLTGDYSINEQYSSSNGGPSISYDLSSHFTESLVPNTETSQMSFFTASPASFCTGGGCNGSYNSGTETDTLTVNFTGLTVGGMSVPTLTETATYTAKYSGSELACAVGDGVSPASGATDCIVWAGAANTWNGSTTLSYGLGNGQALEIFLYNATDWNITPKIGFELDPVTVPEPASLALLGSALVGFGLVRRRQNAS